jgi:hypothetical protein
MGLLRLSFVSMSYPAVKHRARARPRGRAWGVLGLALLLVACDGGGSPGPDAEVPRDAALLDGGGLLDSGLSPSDAAVDAGDAAAPWACPAEVCDPRFPDGCGEDVCVLWGEGASCEVGAGSVSMGAGCETASDCAPGLACFRGRDGLGACGRICCPGDPLACADGSVCGGSGMLVDGTSVPWGQCLPPRRCSVLRPEETCEPREGCYLLDLEGTTECRVAGAGGTGDACMAQEDCQAGFFCGGITGARQCVRICRLGGEECPLEEGRCVAQAHSPEGTGFCTLDVTGSRV